MCDETIYRHLNILYVALKGHGTTWTRKAVNGALGKLINKEFGKTNQTGYYTKLFQISCQYAGNKPRRVWFYYHTVEGGVPRGQCSPRTSKTYWQKAIGCNRTVYVFLPRKWRNVPTDRQLMP